LLFGQFTQRDRVAEFLVSGLNGEIRLSKRDDFFGRIGVLHDKITGVARKVHVLDLTFRVRTDGDYFTGSGKMVGWIVAAVLARKLRFDQHCFEVLPLCIFEDRHQVARRPEFQIVFVNLADTFKKAV